MTTRRPVTRTTSDTAVLTPVRRGEMVPPVSVLEFRPRLWQIVVSWLLFAVCLVLAAWLGRKGHDTFWWVLGHDAVQALGAAALVVGGGATLINVLASRRWTRELQVIAVDLLDETIHHAGVVGQLVAYVLFGRSDSLGEVGHMFKVPWTFFDDTEVEDANRDLQAYYMAIILRVDPEIVARLQQVSAELTDRGDKLRDAAMGLDSCINDPKSLLPLLAAVSELNRKIRLLIDQAPSSGFLVPPSAALISSSAYEVLISSPAYEVLMEYVEVARLIHAPFRQIRADLRDTTLRKQLDEQEDRLKTNAGFERGMREMRALVEETTETAERGEKLIADLTADAKKEDLTESDKEIYDEIITKLNIIVAGVSESARTLSGQAPTASQDAPPDPEGNAAKDPEG